jgi:hypothetical protein
MLFRISKSREAFSHKWSLEWRPKALLVGRDWQNRRSPLDAVTVSHSRTGSRQRDSIRGTLVFRDPVACHKPKTSLHPFNLHPHPSFDDRYPALIPEPQTHQLHMCMSHGTSVSKAQNLATWVWFEFVTQRRTRICTWWQLESKLRSSLLLY